MTEFNDIGISNSLDVPRINKLLTIGLFASLLHFAGDMILGWGTEDETLTGIFRMLSAYISTSDGGIFASALLGLLGMVLEGLAFFGMYRMTAPYSQKYAHSLRTGILGYLMFGVVRIPCPDLRSCVPDKARYLGRAYHAFRRLFCPARICHVLDILPHP